MVLSSWAGGKLTSEEARQSWLASLEPKVGELRQAVRQVPPRQLADRTGAFFKAGDGDRGALWLRYLGREYRLTWPELVAYPEGSDEPCPANLQGLFLYYLHTADGTMPTGQWMAFRELPDGRFYTQAFQGYTGDRLAKVVGNDLEPLIRAARKLGGFRLDFGDVAFRFDVLPRIPLALVYWRGDEEFLPSARVLFDSTASHYMPTDGLAVLGSRLIDLLIDEIQATTSPAPKREVG